MLLSIEISEYLAKMETLRNKIASRKIVNWWRFMCEFRCEQIKENGVKCQNFYKGHGSCERCYMISHPEIYTSQVLGEIEEYENEQKAERQAVKRTLGII